MRGAAGFDLPRRENRTSTVPGGPGAAPPGPFFRPGRRGRGGHGFKECLGSLGRTSEACQLDLPDFLLSQATKNGFHRTPPLSTRTSAYRTARDLNATCHAAVLRLIRPSRSSVRRSRGPLQGKNHQKPLLLLFAINLG